MGGACEIHNGDLKGLADFGTVAQLADDVSGGGSGVGAARGGGDGDDGLNALGSGEGGISVGAGQNDAALGSTPEVGVLQFKDGCHR
ncbi:MAG: hypothetical protein EBV32_00335 [Proteobacteria bacterium]|uniref:Uncharacterized protein n=1 Tax=Candidatus Fonsibacter lacus TaxID=2576439 RepID=A0A964UZI9_9PROT|nr:hypothetical protein [Candidatus Fonsibacter lacus]NCU71647.1 hypothetical protein [Candidatus Fonsibacter lacus]